MKRPRSAPMEAARATRPPEPTVAAAVREQLGCAWSRARELCASGRVRVNGQVCTDPALRVPPGAEVIADETAPRRRAGTLDERALVYFDRDVVVVDKPCGVLSIPYEEGDKDTLVDLTRALLRRRGPGGFDPELSVVHRLDKETTGVMVFARNLEAKRALANAFRDHTIDRVYVAIAHGSVVEGTIRSDLISDRGDGLRGSYGVFRRPRGPLPADAKRAITHVRPIEALRGATLVECRLETGRQHQIRIHLAESGHPLVGERVYVRDHGGERIPAARPMLHARRLGFEHPRTGESMCFEREPPEDFSTLLAALRKRAPTTRGAARR